MSVLRQLNVLGQMRVDVPHIRSVESSIAGDFDVVVGRGLAGDRALVVRGFTLSNVAVGTTASEVQLITADGIVYNVNASESGSFLWIPPDRANEQLTSANGKVTGSFTANAINYIGIDFKRSSDSTTTDLAQFLDANTLKENGRNIPLGRTLDYTIIISSAPFSTTPNITPIAKITTDINNKVTVVQDSRQQMFRLGAGGDFPNPQSSYAYPFGRQENSVTDKFTGGDKNILSNKDWMDAIMTRVWEVGGGENWYSPTADKNIRMARAAAPNVFANGENWETIGFHTHWRGLTVMFENANNPSVFYNEIKDQLTDDVLTLQTLLAAGDCLYVDLDRTQNLTGVNALVMRKAPMQSLGTPTIPGSRLIIAWRTANTGSIDIYTRDYPYLSNVTILPATASSVGGVRLNEAAATGATPTVITIGTNNRVNIGFPPYAPTGGWMALNVAGSLSAPAATFLGGTVGAGGDGIQATGGGTNGNGVVGFGGTAGGAGLIGWGGTGLGDGVNGTGNGAGWGAQFSGGATGGGGGSRSQAGFATDPGAVGIGGTGGGHGVQGIAGGGNGIGGFFTGFGTGAGVWGQGRQTGTSNGTGVRGEAGLTDGMGVHGTGAGSGAGVKGQAGVNSTVSSTAGLGGWFIGATGAYGGDGLRATASATGRSGMFGGGGVDGVGGYFQGGDSTGTGVVALGGIQGTGINAQGGSAGGHGGVFLAQMDSFHGLMSTSGSEGIGVYGIGIGGSGGAGVYGQSTGADGNPGVKGLGDNGGGSGGEFTGGTGGAGCVGTGEGIREGVRGVGGSTSGAGVFGQGGGPNGAGVVGTGTGAGVGGVFSTTSGNSITSGFGGTRYLSNSVPAAGNRNTMIALNVPKAWGMFKTGTLAGAYVGFNVAGSVTVDSNYLYITFTTPMLTADYAVMTTAYKLNNGGVFYFSNASIKTNTGFRIQLMDPAGTWRADLNTVQYEVDFVVFGVQAL